MDGGSMGEEKTAPGAGMRGEGAEGVEGVEGEEEAGGLKTVKGVGWASEDFTAVLARGLGVCIL